MREAIHTRKAKPLEVAQRMRRSTTAAVLFHSAMAECLKLGPTDHKCFDLLNDAGPMTGTALAQITGVTTGAITGVVARLERAGYVERSGDPADKRKQIISTRQSARKDLEIVFGPIQKDLRNLLSRFDAEQREAISRFLDESTALTYRHIARLRGESLTSGAFNGAQTKTSKQGVALA